jgi:hypothetical protein
MAAVQSLGPQEARLQGIPYAPKPATTIHTDIDPLDIGVVVRDSRGHPVASLTKTKADFESVAIAGAQDLGAVLQKPLFCQ